MKKRYDFSKGKRGNVVTPARGKSRITIRLDEEILNWQYQPSVNESWWNIAQNANLLLSDQEGFLDHELLDPITICEPSSDSRRYYGGDNGCCIRANSSYDFEIICGLCLH